MRILKSELLLGSGRGREAEAYSEAVARLRLSPPQVRVAPDLCLYASPPMPTSVCDAPGEYPLFLWHPSFPPPGSVVLVS